VSDDAEIDLTVVENAARAVKDAEPVALEARHSRRSRLRPLRLPAPSHNRQRKRPSPMWSYRLRSRLPSKHRRLKPVQRRRPPDENRKRAVCGTATKLSFWTTAQPRVTAAPFLQK
jgi:hypothetical protein